jgi:hypothetical protein
MWKVVQANAGLITEYEVLQLLRQRGLRTAEEDEAAAVAAASGAGGGEEEEEEEAELGAEAVAAPEPLYPQVNPPFNVERQARFPRRRSLICACSETLAHFVCFRCYALQVFARLSHSPAATQDGEKLANFVQLITARTHPTSTHTHACAHSQTLAQ